MIPILYRHEKYLALDKPSGLSVHRGWDASSENVISVLREQEQRFVYPVHRLDRATSGVLLIGLHESSVAPLSKIFAEGLVQKTYLCLVRGHTPNEGLVDSPVPKDPEKSSSLKVEAQTAFRTLKTFSFQHQDEAFMRKFSLVEAKPLTGRSHQIRRHMRHLQCPIVGDTTYGNSQLNRFAREHLDVQRLFLHASELAFRCPFDDRAQDLESPLPAPLQEALVRLQLLGAMAT